MMTICLYWHNLASNVANWGTLSAYKLALVGYCILYLDPFGYKMYSRQLQNKTFSYCKVMLQHNSDWSISSSNQTSVTIFHGNGNKVSSIIYSVMVQYKQK